MRMWAMPLMRAMSDARLDRQMEVGHHGGLGDARVDDDDRAVFVPDSAFESWQRIG